MLMHVNHKINILIKIIFDCGISSAKSGQVVQTPPNDATH